MIRLGKVEIFTNRLSTISLQTSLHHHHSQLSSYEEQNRSSKTRKIPKQLGKAKTFISRWKSNLLTDDRLLGLRLYDSAALARLSRYQEQGKKSTDNEKIKEKRKKTPSFLKEQRRNRRSKAAQGQHPKAFPCLSVHCHGPSSAVEYVLSYILSSYKFI